MVKYIVDTSVLARLNQPIVVSRLTEIGTYNCGVAVPSLLEMGYSARTHAEHTTMLDALRSTFTMITTSAWAQEHAIQMQETLATAGQHRSAHVADLLIAATAVQEQATVLHYDRDYDTITKITGQPSEWITYPGTLDQPA